MGRKTIWRKTEPHTTKVRIYYEKVNRELGQIYMMRGLILAIARNVNTEFNITKSNEQITRRKKCINLTMSSPISGVILMLLLLIRRVSEVEAPSDLYKEIK